MLKRTLLHHEWMPQHLSSTYTCTFLETQAFIIITLAGNNTVIAIIAILYHCVETTLPWNSRLKTLRTAFFIGRNTVIAKSALIDGQKNNNA